MALTYQSVQTNTSNGSTSVVVTKPTSLAVGDLMLAQYSIHTDTISSTFPSGFTLLDSRIETNNSFTSEIYYKIADAGDVAASNFTFGDLSSTADKAASIIRFTNPNASPFIAYNGQVNSSASTDCATPSIATSPNSVIVLFQASAPSGTGTASGQTIATSPPTFTEIYDLQASSARMQISCAYGLRFESTATGAGSITQSGSRRSIGQIVSVDTLPITSTQTESVTLTDSKILSLAIVISEAISMAENYISDKLKKWTTQNKSSSPTWTNQDKS